MLILGFADYLTQSRKLAATLGERHAEVGLHRFPDGESKIILPPLEGAREIILCRSLDRPNDKLIELLLTVKGLREAGVTRITLVAPYLCYMRQDTAFAAGEVVSQRVIGDWLAGLIDGVITVDPHLHRVRDLAEVFPGIATRTLSAAAPMAEFLGRRPQPPLLLGPDSESAQWVRAIAELAGLDWAVSNKQRHGDRQVHVSLPALDVRGRPVVIVDDMASTGRTLASAAQQLRAAGCASVCCMVTHALFGPDTERLLIQAGIEQIWSTDSVTHPSNTLALAPLLADACRR